MAPSIIRIFSSARATTFHHCSPGLAGPCKIRLLSAHLGPLDLHLTLQWALRLLYLGALALCAGGAARHLRNRDPRVLIAIATPWLLMFALLGQMHERYLVWGAVVSAVALGVNIRLSIVHFIVSAASTAMIVHVMLIDKKLDAHAPSDRSA